MPVYKSLSPGENTLGEVKSNENGEFIIRDLDFPDSTIFSGTWLQRERRKNGRYNYHSPAI